MFYTALGVSLQAVQYEKEAYHWTQTYIKRVNRSDLYRKIAIAQISHSHHMIQAWRD